MSPPALKRRKLAHRAVSERTELVVRNDDAAASTSDVEADQASHSGHSSYTDESMGEEEEHSTASDVDDSNEHTGDEEAEDTRNGKSNGRLPVSKAAAEVTPKAPRRKRDALPEDGVYTAEVFKSNMFKLQVDELLEQVKPKYGKKEAPAEHAMRTLKHLIEQVPSRGPLSIADAEKSFRASKVAIPFPDPLPPKDAKYKLQFERPLNINATGSYPLRIATRANEELAIDLVVTMPPSVFQEKDYLNYRYFYKRAFYLACIAEKIVDSKGHKLDIAYDYLNGNQLQPIIVVRSRGGGGADDFSSSKCCIHIIPSLPENTFQQSKLLPANNCVRPKLTDDQTAKEKVNPTPFYNATIQSDSCVTPYLKLLHASSSKCDTFKDACILGRVWLRQRGFGGRLGKGGFGNFEWAAIMAILLQPNAGTGAPPLSPGYSSYQLFKATLQFLGKRDLLKSPYLFHANGLTVPKHDPAPMFFDGPRNINILFKMTPWSYHRLVREANLTVQTLGESGFDQFEPTFIAKVDSHNLHSDAVLEIPLPPGSGLSPDESGHSLTQTASKLYRTLSKALTDRVTGISIALPDIFAWPVEARTPLKHQHSSVLIAFATDPVNANRTVDHGPAAEDKKEAALFRQFWGEKAELRRFKDGSILESVVWSAKDNARPVLEQIVSYIIRRHFGADFASPLTLSYDPCAYLISAGRVLGQSGVTPFVTLMNALSTVEKDLRGLEGLPLQIRHVFAADPQLRYSSISIPTSPVQAPMRTPASVVIQFEGSGRWPDDLSAIQRTKIAFLMKLAELLASAHPTYTAHVGLENASQPSQNQAFLDVVLPSGPAFRFRIHHDREVTLLKRQLKDKSLDGPSREAAAQALAAYNRNYLRLPLHTQTVQALCTRFPALSPSIRLTKKWFASHHLAPHFAEELIELLVIRTFLQPYPWSVPACATTGFLRTLAWISRWDWRHVPLIVDLSSSLATSGSADGNSRDTGAKTSGMKSEEINKIQTRFEAWRRIDPSLNRVVLFAATNSDHDGTTWTDGAKPEKVVAARMTALARASIAVVKKNDDRLAALVGNATEVPGATGVAVPDSLFASRVQDYDFVLHMSSKFSRPEAHGSDSKFKNLQHQHGVQGVSGIHSAGFDPVATFANELRCIYGDSILFFWNPESPTVVAGLWNPIVTAQRAWKVKAGWNSMPVFDRTKSKNAPGDETRSKGADIQHNRDAVLSEIGRLGNGLIEKIDVSK